MRADHGWAMRASVAASSTGAAASRAGRGVSPGGVAARASTARVGIVVRGIHHPARWRCHHSPTTDSRGERARALEDAAAEGRRARSLGGVEASVSSRCDAARAREPPDATEPASRSSATRLEGGWGGAARESRVFLATVPAHPRGSRWGAARESHLSHPRPRRRAHAFRGSVSVAAKGKGREFMDDLSLKFPEEMEQTRLRVQRDVRRSLRAAKHLVAAQVCFVIAIVLVKQCLQHFTPSGFLASRAVVSLPFILALSKSDPDADAEFKREAPELFASGYLLFLGALVFLGQALLAQGLERVSVANTVVLGQLVPVYSCTIAVFQGVEKPSAGKFAAIGAGVLGAAVMLDPAKMWLSGGNLFLLARAAVFAAYLALQAPILRAYLPVTVATTAQLVGAAAAVAFGVPVALRSGGFRAAAGALQDQPLAAWSLVVGVAAFSAAAYTLTAKAERHTTPVVAACYNSLQPVIATVVMCAFGEVPGARNLLGSALIVLGGLAAVALSTNDRGRWKQVYPAGDFGVDRLSSTATQKRGGTVSSRKGGGGDGRLERAVGGTELRRRDDRVESSESESGSVSSRSSRVREDGTRTGTVRMAKRPGSANARRPIKVGTMVWTVAWALVMSLCALAGGGLLTWSLVYLYWKYLC